MWVQLTGLLVAADLCATQFYLVHKGAVDVPAMYDPAGRYRYTAGFVSCHSAKFRLMIYLSA